MTETLPQPDPGGTRDLIWGTLELRRELPDLTRKTKSTFRHDGPFGRNSEDLSLTSVLKASRQMTHAGIQALIRVTLSKVDLSTIFVDKSGNKITTPATN